LLSEKEAATVRKKLRDQKTAAALFPAVEEESGKKAAEKEKLQFELESWRSFAKALRLEDRQLLNRMLEKIWSFNGAVENSKRGYETEAFLLSLLILQQKTIDRLEEKVAEKKKRQKGGE
jgi:hypothetical protein